MLQPLLTGCSLSPSVCGANHFHLSIWRALRWGTAWERHSAQNKHKMGVTAASTELNTEGKRQHQNCEDPAAFHTRDVANYQHKQKI